MHACIWSAFIVRTHLAAELLTVTKALTETASNSPTDILLFTLLFSFAAAGFGGFGGGGSLSQAQAQAQAQSFSQGAYTHQQSLHLMLRLHNMYISYELACLESRPLADRCLQEAHTDV